MTEIERQLRASLAHTDHDAPFVLGMRARIDARPLSESAHAIAIGGDDAARLVRLAEEALRARAKLIAPPAVGARGTLVAAIAGDDRNRLIAIVEFNCEDELRLAAKSIASDVVLEPAPPELKAANEQGEGSPSNDEEDDT